MTIVGPPVTIVGPPVTIVGPPVTIVNCVGNVIISSMNQHQPTIMKRSTILFNVAAVALFLGISLALVDLMKHKAKAPQRVVVTFAPTPAATVAASLAT